MLAPRFTERFWFCCLLGGLVATASLGCGGKAETNTFVDPGSGGSGGSGGVSSTVASLTSGPSTTGTTAPAEACLQPIESGTCDAYFPSFGYNTESGRCEEFVYGGCGGNDNRFESLDACLAACDPNGNKRCERSSDCAVDHGCCGLCGLTDPAALVAVNQKYAAFNAPECELVECDTCRTPEAIGPFGAMCNAGTCEIFDIRTSRFSECRGDYDCHNRAGVACCDSCDDAHVVAVALPDAAFLEEMCPEYAVNCDCKQSLHWGYHTPVCRDGHCIAEKYH